MDALIDENGYLYSPCCDELLEENDCTTHFAPEGTQTCLKSCECPSCGEIICYKREGLELKFRPLPSCGPTMG